MDSYPAAWSWTSGKPGKSPKRETMTRSFASPGPVPRRKARIWGSGEGLWYVDWPIHGLGSCQPYFGGSWPCDHRELFVIGLVAAMSHREKVPGNQERHWQGTTRYMARRVASYQYQTSTAYFAWEISRTFCTRYVIHQHQSMSRPNRISNAKAI